MPVTPPGSIGAWSSTYLTKFLNDWLRRNPLPAQDQLTIKKLTVSASASAPTPNPGDSSTSIATTAFVSNAIATTSPVTSVFTRTGAVTAQSGDYTAAQVTNAADKSSGSTQFFTGAVFSGANPGMPTSSTGAGATSTGTLRALVAGTANIALQVGVANNADTTDRLRILGDGSLNYSSGTAAADLIVSRGGANLLLVSAPGASTQLRVGNGTQVGQLAEAGGGITLGQSAANKISFYNVTPIAQPSAAGAATGYTAGTTAATFHSDDKYSGNVGTTGYTINGIVAALKNLGLIHT